MKIGDKVKFIGCSKAQKQWDNNDNADKLILGSEYIISNIDEHSWHTKISFEEIGGQFNSVCFEDI